MPIPITTNDELVCFGKSGLNVKAVYGVNADDFLEIHESLADKGLKVLHEEPKIYILFELYCKELMDMKFDITNIIVEFNESQEKNGLDIIHSLALVKVCYFYNKFGFDVQVVRTDGKSSTPDLIINGINCDLKIRHDQINKEMRMYFHLIEKDKELYYKIWSEKIKSRIDDLKSALESRAEKGFDQADCLIFDLSSHFHSWNYHRIKSYVNKHKSNEFSEKPLEPIKGICIIFSPDNALDLIKRKFEPKAYWTYVCWNSEKREFVDLCQS